MRLVQHGAISGQLIGDRRQNVVPVWQANRFPSCESAGEVGAINHAPTGVQLASLLLLGCEVERKNSPLEVDDKVKVVGMASG